MRTSRSLFLLGMLFSLLSISGCEGYTETVRCSMGQVLNDADECVPPPLPDGGPLPDGASPDSGSPDCAAFCATVPTWTEANRSCVQMGIASVGGSCADLTTESGCLACTSAGGVSDAVCALAANNCL